MRVLGDVDASPELDLATLDVEPGERWLLCSDGLNYVAGHVVERTVRETKDLRECVETLVDLTLEAGAPDNVTVVMLEIAEQTPDDVRTAAVEIVQPQAGSAVAAGAAALASTPAPADQIPDEDAQLPDARDGTGAEQPPEAAPGAGDGPEPKPAGDDASGDDRAGSTDGGALAPATPGRTKTAEPSATTDPHLGEHLSAAVLREELSTRPHELVGRPRQPPPKSGSIPTIAGRTVARRAATVLTHKSDQGREETDEYKPAAKPRRWVTIATAAALLVILSVGLWLGYAWTQTRYYIGEYDQRVAIYNGVSQRLGPIQLSTLETVTEIRMSDLPEFSQQRVRQTVPARDLYDAQRIVKNLDLTGTTSPADECPTPSPTSTAAPSASGAAPAPSGTAAPPGTPTPTATPSPTANACEEAK